MNGRWACCSALPAELPAASGLVAWPEAFASGGASRLPRTPQPDVAPTKIVAASIARAVRYGSATLIQLSLCCRTLSPP